MVDLPHSVPHADQPLQVSEQEKHPKLSLINGAIPLIGVFKNIHEANTEGQNPMV